MSAPALVLTGDFFRMGPQTPGHRDYDVFPDESFLTLKEEGSRRPQRIEVVVNWASQQAATRK